MALKDLNVVTPDFLSKVKLSLRLDIDDDDDLLKAFIITARKDIAGQVGEQIDDFYDDNEVFDTAVILEASHFYAHRESVSNLRTYEVPMALSYLINSLKDEYRLELKLKGFDDYD